MSNSSQCRQTYVSQDPVCRPALVCHHCRSAAVRQNRNQDGIWPESASFLILGITSENRGNLNVENRIDISHCSTSVLPMIARRTALLVLVAAFFPGASAGALLVWGPRLQPTTASVSSLPDEDETGLYEPVSFARMNRIIAICNGC
jgi:hypothetical protein